MRIVSVCLTALVATACRSNTAPLGFLPSPQEAPADAHGGWIELSVRGVRQNVEGELLAVTSDSVWVLTRDSAVVVPTANVIRGKLTAYAAPSTMGWTLLGVLSTVSNGVILLITAPTWMLTSAIATDADTRAAQRSTPQIHWADLAMFARFPQGMPEGMALGSLKPKAP